MRRVFRVCRAVHAGLDGEGARLVGGRWNSPGLAVVYMAETISLAVLENLVHMNREDFPLGYVVIGALIPNGILILSSDQVRTTEGDIESQTLGDRWIRSGASAVLKVPSAVVPSEFDYPLNPRHPEFSLIVPEPSVPFKFDERLFRR